ncbi:MAG: hypothetical protein F6K16_20530 [Symploca sp. SIO2B6]|nr:hypothetical protein [Symploca sp. SIO2B6]
MTKVPHTGNSSRRQIEVRPSLRFPAEGKRTSTGVSEKRRGEIIKQTLQTLQTLQTRRIQIPRKISFTSSTDYDRSLLARTNGYLRKASIRLLGVSEAPEVRYF